MRVAVIGCGLIGRRRAATAAAHPGSRLVGVADTEEARAQSVAAEHGAAVFGRWHDALERDDVDAVVVSTPNHLLADIACASLGRGKHVLLEKPMGRSLAEAERIAAAARAAGRTLKVGFNHRFHPALARARALVAAGEIGAVLSIRARYGHGSRPGCEHEWRADPERAGGGELMDQGVHIADLVHWFAGVPDEAFCITQTAFWPIAPLEDNAFGLFRWHGGRVAQLHVSMTQWKNLFSFEVTGEHGSVVVDGLGGSYGPERLVVAKRRPEGGVPELAEEEFAGPDPSWSAEWGDFVEAVVGGGTGDARSGDAAAGVAAMRMIAALYRSAEQNAVVTV